MNRVSTTTFPEYYFCFYDIIHINKCQEETSPNITICYWGGNGNHYRREMYCKDRSQMKMAQYCIQWQIFVSEWFKGTIWKYIVRIRGG
jgi:hypothetical protein